MALPSLPSPYSLLSNAFVREVVGVLLSVAILLGAVQLYKRHIQAQDREHLAAVENQLKVAALDVKAQMLEQERDAALAKVDSIAKVAKTQASVQVVKYRTIRDTINLTDTVEVKAGFVAADSAIAADSVAIATCDTARAATQTQLDSVKADRVRIRAERDSAIYGTVHGHFPTNNVVVSRTRAALWILGALGAGYVAGHR